MPTLKTTAQIKSRSWLLLIFLAALLLRLGGGLVVARQIKTQKGAAARFLFPDERSFYTFANNLATTGEYIDSLERHAWRTPVYSLLLAAFIKVGISPPSFLRGVNIAIDLLNVWLAYYLGCLFFNRRSGLLAAAMLAGYPFFIYFSNLLLADTLGVTAAMLIALAAGHLVGLRVPDKEVFPAEKESAAAGETNNFHYHSSSPSRRQGEWTLRYSETIRNAALVGLALAFAIMVKASYALFGVLLLIFLWWRLKPGLVVPTQPSEFPSYSPPCLRSCARQHTAAAIPIIVIIFMVGMAPWWLRNQQVFHAFVPFSTAGGYALFEANSEFADGGPNNGKIVFPIVDSCTEIAPAEIELNQDSELKSASRKWVTKNPLRFLSLMPKKFLRTWNVMPNYDKASAWKYKLLCFFSYLPVMLLAGFAAWVFRTRWREVYLLLLPTVYFAALHSIFMGSIRYRFSAMGCLIVLAAAGLDYALAKIFFARKMPSLT